MIDYWQLRSPIIPNNTHITEDARTGRGVYTGTHDILKQHFTGLSRSIIFNSLVCWDPSSIWFNPTSSSTSYFRRSLRNLESLLKRLRFLTWECINESLSWLTWWLRSAVDTSDTWHVSWAADMPSAPIAYRSRAQTSRVSLAWSLSRGPLTHVSTCGTVKCSGGAWIVNQGSNLNSLSIFLILLG